MTDRVLVLDYWQVYDRGKGCFFLGLKETKRKYLGLAVYEDKLGRRIAIRNTGES